MTIDLGHGVTATRDTTCAASWSVYIGGLFYARVSTEAIARCIHTAR